MIEYLEKDSMYKIFGVSVISESISNFTYKLRFPYSPRNEDRDTDWKDWKTDILFPVFPQLGPRAKLKNTGGDPGKFKNYYLIL